MEELTDMEEEVAKFMKEQIMDNGKRFVEEDDIMEEFDMSRDKVMDVIDELVKKDVVADLDGLHNDEQ